MKKIAALVSLLLILARAGCAVAPLGGTAPGSVFIGRYPSAVDGPDDPLEWRVLGSEGGELLLVCKSVIDARAYQASGSPAWSASDIRAWLNGAFCDAAFTASEKAALTGADKVTLLTRAQAENPAYFADDSARSAAPTGLASSRAGYGGSGYWLMDDAGNPLAVDSTGAVVSAGAAAVSGVRPVIRVDLDRVVAYTDISSMLGIPSGTNSFAIINLPIEPYIPVVLDETMPAIAITGYGFADNSLILACAPSAPLNAGQMIYCYVKSSGLPFAYGTYATLTDGVIRISNFSPEKRYDLSLCVVSLNPTFGIAASGPVSVVDDLDMLCISGIAEGDEFEEQELIAFSASTLHQPPASPADGEVRWVPAGWAAGAQSGVWSGPPYQADVRLPQGDYTLVVSYRAECYESDTSDWLAAGGSDSRSVNFKVKAASGGDTPVYESRTLESLLGVTVSGSRIGSGANLYAEALDPGSLPEALRKAVQSGALILGCEVRIIGDYVGPVEISFPVGAAYEGKTVTILHYVGGKVQSFTALVKNGRASALVDSLSPFAVIAGASAAVPPQTGDASTAAGLVMAALGLIACGALAYRRFRRS